MLPLLIRGLVVSWERIRSDFHTVPGYNLLLSCLEYQRMIVILLRD